MTASLLSQDDPAHQAPQQPALMSVKEEPAPEVLSNNASNPQQSLTTDQEILLLQQQLMKLKVKNSLLKNKLQEAKMNTPSKQHETQLQELTKLVESLPSEYAEELKEQINFDYQRETQRCLVYVHDMCYELKDSVEWHITRLEQNFDDMDDPKLDRLLRTAKLSDDVIRAVTDSVVREKTKVIKAISTWKRFSESLQSVCSNKLASISQ